MDDLILDPLTHIYTYRGECVPSVTQILDAAGIIDNRWGNEEARLRGQHVHEAISYMHDGDLDWDSVRPEIIPYLRAFEKFKAETNFSTCAAERSYIHEKLKYAGTPDVSVGLIHGNKYLIDFKTGAYHVSQAVQVAAYLELVKPVLTLPPKEARIIELRDDETYRIHDPRFKKPPINHLWAWNIFLTAHNLYRFKESYGYDLARNHQHPAAA